MTKHPASLARGSPPEPGGTSACVPSQTGSRRGRRQAPIDGETTTGSTRVGPVIRGVADAAVRGNVRVMTAPTLLDMAAIGDRLGLTIRTIRNYHQAAERNRRLGTIRPGDFPPPDLLFGRSPVWKAATIRAWQNRRPGQGAGGGRPRKEPT